LKVGDRSFKCTEYEVKNYNTTMKACYSAELPPVFNGGNIVMETDAEGVKATVTLTDFSGKKVGE
jgi:hypothetical protein